jgi:hypothetical protein
MANQFLKLRRSAVPGRIPSTSSLDFGEIALNTYDGLAFMKKSGSNGEQVVIIGSDPLDITGSANFVPLFNGASSLVTSSIYQTGSFTGINTTAPDDPNNPDMLLVNSRNIPTYNIISAHGEIDNYSQLNVQNFSSGSFASSDVVATADNGTESTRFINMGINSSGYAVSNAVGSAGDSYLYSVANDMYIGNTIPGHQLVFFNGGEDALANAHVWIFDQGTVGINTDTYNQLAPPSLQVKSPNNLTYNLILAESDINNYSQINIQNINPGQEASSDIVATADNGDEESYYINMGINSSGYILSGSVGNANDAYIYSTGNHLHIGNASANQPIMFFAGGFDADLHQKLLLNPNNQHEMTGSLSITEGVTGSLYGTSSWAENALTASYVAASSVVGLSLFQIATGSITASVGLGNDLFLIKSGSKTYFNISSSGDTTIYSSNFMIRDFNTNEMVFQVSASRAYFDFDGITIATQSVAPTGSADVGGILFTSTAMYIGLE